MDRTLDQSMKNFYLGIVLANPFIISVARLAPAIEMAGASSCSLPSGESDPSVKMDLAPADLVAARTDVLQTVVATASASDEPESFDCIAEIFAGHARAHAYRFARKPTNKARVTPSREFIPDEEALFEQIEENPMFLQEPLRRAG